MIRDSRIVGLKPNRLELTYWLRTKLLAILGYLLKLFTRVDTTEGLPSQKKIKKIKDHLCPTKNNYAIMSKQKKINSFYCYHFPG